MSETPHAKLRKEICAYLASIGAWYVSTNSQGYGRKGIPDILCCYRGRFVAIEVKAGRDKPSPWQLRELGGITTSGGLSVVAYSLQEVTDVLT